MIRNAIGNAVVWCFEKLTPDINGIYSTAKDYNLDDWCLLQKGLTTASGAGSVAIPFLHLAGTVADVGFLMNRMAVCSYGIGAILGSRAGENNILEEEDFAIILARWSGDDSLSNAAIAKTGAGLAGHVGGKAATKILAKVAAENAGVLIGKKLGAKVSTKVTAKFAAKLGTKALGGFIPFVGPAIGGGINLWFITSIAGEADAWYRLKLSIRERQKGIE